jgi:hypothetical protein
MGKQLMTASYSLVRGGERLPAEVYDNKSLSTRVAKLPSRQDGMWVVPTVYQPEAYTTVRNPYLLPVGALIVVGSNVVAFSAWAGRDFLGGVASLFLGAFAIFIMFAMFPTTEKRVQ